jgi:hypothetical protein
MTKYADPPNAPELPSPSATRGTAWTLGAEIADLINARPPDDPARRVLLELIDGFRTRFIPRGAAPAPELEVPATTVVTKVPPRGTPRRDEPGAPRYDRSNPRAARLLSVVNLDYGARLLSFDVESSGLEGRLGDRVALCPRNDPEEVRRILRAFGVRGVEPIDTLQGPSPAWRILLEDVDIRNLSEPVEDLLRGRLLTRDERATFDDFVTAARPSLLATIRRFPKLANRLGEVVRALEPMRPIFGHLCEPLGANPTTLAVLLSERAHRASQEGGLDLSPGTWIPLYVEEHVDCHLPDDSDLPLVLLADPSTLPLARGYVLERQTRLHRGRTWVLAFGVTNSTPFVDELLGWLDAGKLTRFDVIGELDTAAAASALIAERDMLFRWFVDRSAFLIIGSDPERAERLHSNVSALLLAASKKDASWLENARAERRDADLYQLHTLT